MNMLYATFAMKTKPDDTINRIKELEKCVKELSDHDDQSDKCIDDLTKRLETVEKKVEENHDNHEPRIKTLEDALKAL